MKKTWWFFALILILVYLLISIVKDKYKVYNVELTIRKYNEQNITLEKENEFLKSEINYVSTLSYQDKAIKEKQWMKNPWEMVVYIRDKELQKKEPIFTINRNISYREESNLKKWQRFFNELD